MKQVKENFHPPGRGNKKDNGPKRHQCQSLLVYLWKHKSLLIAFYYDFNLLYFSESTPTVTRRSNFQLSLRWSIFGCRQQRCNADSTEWFMILAPLININNGFNLSQRRPTLKPAALNKSWVMNNGMQRGAPASTEWKEHHVEKNKQKLRRILTRRLGARLQVSQQRAWLILEEEEKFGGDWV